MNLRPHAHDVVQITGHTLHQGADLHGMVAHVDSVDDEVVTVHIDNHFGGILARAEDLEVLYRLEWK